MNEYKSVTRAAIKKATTDIERDWGGPGVASEWLVLYVRPFELEISDKGARCVSNVLLCHANIDCIHSQQQQFTTHIDHPENERDIVMASDRRPCHVTPRARRAH